MFSIVLATYNNEDSLGQAILSILNQSYTTFELIIIDDGSTDKTSDIINSFNDKRIVLLRNQGNFGLAYSLNRGVQIAKNDWIVRMDADDTMLYNRLEKTLPFLRPETQMLAFSALIDSMTSHRVPQVRFWKVPFFFLFSNRIIHPAVTIRKKVLIEVPYDENLRRAQDVDLWIRIAKLNMNVDVIQMPVIVYKENISKDKRIRAYEAILMIERNNFDSNFLRFFLRLKKFLLAI